MAFKSTKKSGFVYKPRDASVVKKRAERSGRQFDSMFKDGFDVYKPEVGDNCVRVLPPTFDLPDWQDNEHFGLTIYAHRYVGPDSGSYLCRYKMLGKACAICDAANAARKAGEEDEAKALTWRENVIDWIVDRNDDPTLPQLWLMSWMQDRDITALTYTKKGVLEVDNPDYGYDLTFKRTGKDKTTRYSAFAFDREDSPVHDRVKEQDAIIDFIQENPLTSVLQFYPNDYLERMISGMTDTAMEDDDRPRRRARLRDDDEEPRERRRARPNGRDEEEPRRRGRVEDDELPRAMRGRGRDEEEEEERPARRRSRLDEEEEPRRAPTRRARPAEDEEEPPRSRRASRGLDDRFEDEEPPRRSRRRRDDDEIPF